MQVTLITRSLIESGVRSQPRAAGLVIEQLAVPGWVMVCARATAHTKRWYDQWVCQCQPPNLIAGMKLKRCDGNALHPTQEKESWEWLVCMCVKIWLLYAIVHYKSDLRFLREYLYYKIWYEKQSANNQQIQEKNWWRLRWRLYQETYINSILRATYERQPVRQHLLYSGVFMVTLLS